jgi:glycosyltransferase involved in cell wall biosynthesis
METQSPIELSVVLISKNQAWNISRLIESVLQATSSIGSTEIILVDSASTDQTVEVAKRYPICILRLRPEHPLSPSAGRYVGYKHSSGEFVLFLDGDMEVLDGWLEDSLCNMRNAQHAGVLMSTQLINLHPQAAGDTTSPREKIQPTPPREVSFAPFVAGGAALYRRAVLEQVGTFNPHLFSDEEPELCLRIRHAGYRILLVDYPIVRHFSDTSTPESIPIILSRRRRKFLMGVGQCLRYHIGTPLFWPYVRERGLWSLFAVLWLAVGLAALAWSLLTRHFLWLDVFLLSLTLLIGVVTWRKRSLRRAFVGVFHRLLMVEGVIKGFLMAPSSAESYPQDAEVIQDVKIQKLAEKDICSSVQTVSTEARFGNDKTIGSSSLLWQ